MENRTKAFTLVELLSIITILVLIWPIRLINKYMPVLLGRRGEN